MKQICAFIAMAGLAASASAQHEGWLLSASEPILSPGTPTTTITLSATFPAADYAFAGARVTVSASESGWGTPSLILMGPGTTAGTVVGADVTGIVVGQLNFPPGGIFADPSNPIDVWQADFTATDFTIRSWAFTTTTTQFAVYPDRDSSISEERSPIAEGEGRIEIIPAPGALAMLGLGGLALARRRR